MRKIIFWTIAGIISILFLSVYINDFYELLTKSYYINESSLCRVDTFHLLSKAYDQPTTNSDWHSDESELVFKSTNGYSFAIDSGIYNAINDKEKLKDTLMYHDTKFTVFSDTASCREYRESKTPIFLRVYQLQIGSRKYIDVLKIND